MVIDERVLIAGVLLAFGFGILFWMC